MQAIEELRRLGFEIEADGDRVRVRHHTQPQPEALALLAYMRQHKAEVLAELTKPRGPEADTPDPERGSDVDLLEGIVAPGHPLPPALPKCVRLVSYFPLEPPVAVEQCSIVTNVDLFIRSSLADLEDRLNHPKAGRWCPTGG